MSTLSDEERAACATVERLCRDLNLCEVRLWNRPWFNSDREGVDISVYLRTTGEPLEITGVDLAEAIERARERA